MVGENCTQKPLQSTCGIDDAAGCDQGIGNISGFDIHSVASFLIFFTFRSRFLLKILPDGIYLTASVARLQSIRIKKCSRSFSARKNQYNCIRAIFKSKNAKFFKKLLACM
jgi:hypothetical protein